MAAWKKALIAAGALAAVVLGLVFWYRVRYSMAPAGEFEVAGAPSGPRVLIATQGSRFKDAVVSGVVDHLRARKANLRVIDVSDLPAVRTGEWDAIVVIHTWEMRRPPPAVEAFVDGMPDRRKLVVLTTSGAGDFKMDGIDAISAASRMEDVSDRVARLSARVDAVLAGQSPAPEPHR